MLLHILYPRHVSARGPLAGGLSAAVGRQRAVGRGGRAGHRDCRTIEPADPGAAATVEPAGAGRLSARAAARRATTNCATWSARSTCWAISWTNCAARSSAPSGWRCWGNSAADWHINCATASPARASPCSCISATASQIDQDSLAVALRQLSLTESHLQRFLTVGQPSAPRRGRCDLRQVVADVAALLGPACDHHNVALRARRSRPRRAASCRPTPINCANC